MDTVKHILSIEHKENILTGVGDSHFSPLSIAFHKKNTAFLKLIGLYMKINQNTFEKTDLIGKDKGNIIFIIKP
jgi:hypothetical protein